MNSWFLRTSQSRNAGSPSSNSLLIALSESVHLAAVLLRRFAINKLIGRPERLAILDDLHPRFAAGIGFSIERLCDGSGTAHFTNSQNLDMKIAAVIFYSQHVANSHLARRLCRVAA